MGDDHGRSEPALMRKAQCEVDQARLGRQFCGSAVSSRQTESWTGWIAGPTSCSRISRATTIRYDRSSLNVPFTGSLTPELDRLLGVAAG
jgi:hypothetical protein